MDSECIHVIDYHNLSFYIFVMDFKCALSKKSYEEFDNFQQAFSTITQLIKTKFT
jgi:hypothetical protein